MLENWPLCKKLISMIILRSRDNKWQLSRIRQLVPHLRTLINWGSFKTRQLNWAASNWLARSNPLIPLCARNPAVWINRWVNQVSIAHRLQTALIHPYSCSQSITNSKIYNLCHKPTCHKPTRIWIKKTITAPLLLFPKSISSRTMMICLEPMRLDPT